MVVSKSIYPCENRLKFSLQMELFSWFFYTLLLRMARPERIAEELISASKIVYVHSD